MNWVEIVSANAVSVLVGGMIPILLILLKERIDFRRRLGEWFEKRYIEESFDVLHEFFSKWAFLSALPARNVQELLANPVFAEVPSQSASRLVAISGGVAFQNWFNALRALWLRAAHHGDWNELVKFHTHAASFAEHLGLLRLELLGQRLRAKADIYAFRRLPSVARFNETLKQMTDDLVNDPKVTTYTRQEETPCEGQG